jgi:hypothetical protein
MLMRENFRGWSRAASHWSNHARGRAPATRQAGKYHIASLNHVNFLKIGPKPNLFINNSANATTSNVSLQPL